MKRFGMFVLLALVAVVAAGCMGSSDRSTRQAAIGSSAPVAGQASIEWVSATGSQKPFAVQSWDWGVETPTTISSATGGAGVGKASFNEFRIQKNIDNVSPVLYKAAATGQNIATLTLRVGTQLTYTFSTVFVTKVEQSGEGNDGNEQVTFVFGKLRTDNLTSGTIVSSCWDVVLSRAC